MEKNYREDLAEQETIMLAVKALLEVVEAGSKNFEAAVIRLDGIEFLSEEALANIVNEIENTKKSGEQEKV